MTGPAGGRVYLDWNATAPLRPEARAAMIAAMDMVGNPASVHAEGRAARAIIEHAREEVAALAGCPPAEVVFTSGATEAAALVLAGARRIAVPATAHDALHGWAGPGDGDGPPEVVCWPMADSETGILHPPPDCPAGAVLLADASQVAGRLPLAADPAPGLPRPALILSAHKIGGPKGVGALILPEGVAPHRLLRGGGQERGRRPGTENVVGIAGFGAAAAAARRDLASGVWRGVENLRDMLENRLAAAAPDLVVIGAGRARLPNTSCFALPGWKGETQVMQMDLAGFAVSAGSACSSGRVGPSRVLQALGHDARIAASAIRVSLGPATTGAEIDAFARVWIDHYRRRLGRAA